MLSNPQKNQSNKRECQEDEAGEENVKVGERRVAARFHSNECSLVSSREAMGGCKLPWRTINNMLHPAVNNRFSRLKEEDANNLAAHHPPC